MRGVDILALKVQLGMESNNELCRALGISYNYFYKLLKMKKVPRKMALACAALAAGLDEYEVPDHISEQHVRAASRETINWLMKERLKEKKSRLIVKRI